MVFFEKFDSKNIQKIQEDFYKSLNKEKTHTMFFTWFQNYYFKKDIYYPFNDINVLKTWKTTTGEVYSEHPPLREFRFTHEETTIVASPFKIKLSDEI